MIPLYVTPTTASYNVPFYQYGYPMPTVTTGMATRYYVWNVTPKYYDIATTARMFGYSINALTKVIKKNLFPKPIARYGDSYWGQDVLNMERQRRKILALKAWRAINNILSKDSIMSERNWFVKSKRLSHTREPKYSHREVAAMMSITEVALDALVKDNEFPKPDTISGISKTIQGWPKSVVDRDL